MCDEVGVGDASAGEGGSCSVDVGVDFEDDVIGDDKECNKIREEGDEVDVDGDDALVMRKRGDDGGHRDEAVFEFVQDWEENVIRSNIPTHEDTKVHLLVCDGDLRPGARGAAESFFVCRGGRSGRDNMGLVRVHSEA